MFCLQERVIGLYARSSNHSSVLLKLGHSSYIHGKASVVACTSKQSIQYMVAPRPMNGKGPCRLWNIGKDFAHAVTQDCTTEAIGQLRRKKLVYRRQKETENVADRGYKNRQRYPKNIICAAKIQKEKATTIVRSEQIKKK